MKKRSLLFWDLQAKGYSKKPVADEAAYQKKIEKTREYLNLDTEVFEFGCGTGSTAIRHAPLVKHILAIDGSAKMIEIAQKKADSEKIKNITFKTETIDAFSSPKESYDVVLGMNILHLVKNKEEVVSQVHDMLKPGGVFISSTVCLSNTSIFFTLLSKVGGIVGLTLRLFTKEELKESIVNAGFEIEHEWQPEGEGIQAVFIVAKKV